MGILYLLNRGNDVEIQIAQQTVKLVVSVDTLMGSIPELEYMTFRWNSHSEYSLRATVSGACGNKCAPVVVHDSCEITTHRGEFPSFSHCATGPKSPSLN
jgi:hypothetical protein